MASDWSTYVGNKLVRWLAGNAFPAAPGGLYVALFNGDPKGAGVEVTTTIRAAGRVAVDLEASPVAGTDNSITTDGDSDFGPADGAATVTHVAICDAAAAGNVIVSKQLVASVDVEAGEQVKFVAGDLTFTHGS